MKNTLTKGDIVIAKYGFNTVLNKPFEFKYDFGYYTKTGCVVYNEGEHNMQDSHHFELEQVRLATEEDKKRFFAGS